MPMPISQVSVIATEVQCIACGTHDVLSMMDEGRDDDGPFWTCMNRAACLRRVRVALKSQPDLSSATWISEVADEVNRLRARVDALEREVRRLRSRTATYN